MALSPPLPGNQLPNRRGAPPPLSPPGQGGRSDSIDLLAAVKQALVSGTHPPASILHAVADLARTLTGANGVALALRTRGVIACRARSGDIAPEIGTPLNVNSGISGECLRTASILLCNDAATDHRVDPEACRALGIRSIVVVPLRGPTGIVGILEAFSAHPGAFGDDEINSLRGLAEIAEAAYQREHRSKDGAVAPMASTSRPARVAKLSNTDQGVVEELLDEPSYGRRFWILGVAAVALLLTCAVMWLSWRDPTPEMAASEPASQTLTTAATNSSHTPPPATPAKPQPGIASRQPEHPRPAGLLQNAADIQPAGGKSDSASPARDVSPAKRSGDGLDPSPTLTSAAEQPPSIEVAVSAVPDTLPHLGSGPAALPALDVKVSEGVTPATLMHRVDPIYPPAARVKRLDGSVTLDATIATDGNIRAVKILSGSQLLAAAAETAVRQWRYSPALLNGKPVEIQKQITIVFKLP